MKIFQRKREEVSGDWCKYCSEELHDLCSSQNIIQVMTSRKMRWVGHVGEKRNAYRVSSIFVL
jgi:hypothetical protein